MQKIYEAFRAGDRQSAKAHVADQPTLAIFAAAIFGDAAEIETLLAGNRSLVSAESRRVVPAASGGAFRARRCGSGLAE